MLWLKACPRCKGDLFEEKDIYGRYVSCAQCGHYLTEAQDTVLRLRGRTGLRSAVGGASVKDEALVSAGRR